MKRSVLALISFVLLASTAAMAGEFFFDTIMNQVITGNVPAKAVNLQGYKEYALLGRFEGQPNQSFDIEINNNQQLVAKETVQINAQGWVNFNKVYPVYAPSVAVVVYHAPANTKAKMTIYAGH